VLHADNVSNAATESAAIEIRRIYSPCMLRKFYSSNFKLWVML